MTTQTIDQAKAEAFINKALGDASATLTALLCSIGDRLGLFKDLAENGPATSEQFATRAGINERYAREWLGGMASAGYVRYDPATRRFDLPAEHNPVLVEEGGHVFFGGLYQMLPAAVPAIGRITEAFKKGGGADQSTYGPDWWAGMERFTADWFETFLLQEWIPSMPDVRARLDKGCDFADVGCGSGRALIKLARAHPNSSYDGYDIFQTQVDRATENATKAGLSGRLTFRQADVSKGLPRKYDVISTFDVIHDAVNPRGLLRGIRQSLKDGGIYICLDINCSDKLEENAGPLGALFHGFSVLLHDRVAGAGRRRAGHCRLSREGRSRDVQGGRFQRGAPRDHGQPLQQPVRDTGIVSWPGVASTPAERPDHSAKPSAT